MHGGSDAMQTEVHTPEPKLAFLREFQTTFARGSLNIYRKEKVSNIRCVEKLNTRFKPNAAFFRKSYGVRHN
jgi:hypothetical protein